MNGHGFRWLIFGNFGCAGFQEIGNCLLFRFRFQNEGFRWLYSGAWNRETASTGILSFERFQTFFNLY
ncbi:unnamed protein product [Rhizophagus irregularis]|nr:unnamed protein product [Rhizophagus irregularis]